MYDVKWNLLQLDNGKYILEYMLENLIDEREYELDNYINYNLIYFYIISN